ncbi:SH3 domain-containing protein [uncultured Hyphomicrobium sp.]|uniref:SH3 domain-containing protein n=1 Tax=uncultured Hyphomicrobium sp. TaxID=194373 RepID=UPI0025EDD7DF|nr:SH3 domain-containing protein [uncultured Hyphomicrobium sp.]
MRKWTFVCAVIGAMVASAAAAQAAPGYSTTDVNMRAGPDTEFPSVEIIPEGTSLEIAGCLDDESWCDVIAGGNRGWVFSEYLAFERGGSYVLLPDIGLSALRIPEVKFTAADYWQRHYVGRPWYAERTRWIAFKPHVRVGWRRPPPGPRVVGWWRHGYAAPVGMRPPPEHGWMRPHEPREHERH